VGELRHTSGRTDLERSLDEFVQSIGAGWGEAYELSGYVHIVRKGKVLYSRGFGYANRAVRRANTADTSFRIGSVTKQFTAAAVMLLAERGALSLTDTIRKHLPSYPAAGDRITLHHLLTHTSGIPSYTDLGGIRGAHDDPYTADRLLALFAELPLEFEPGQKFGYSNSNYVVLGAVIEAASGQTYANFLRTSLFEPAGLDRTVVGDAEGMMDRALGYESNSMDELELAPATDMSLAWAAGGVRSTARDLARWHQALASGRVLSDSSRAMMLEPDGVAATYGYGWRIARRHGRRVAEESGAIDAFATRYVRVPDEDLLIVVWSNNGIAPAPIADAALTVVLGDGKLAPFDDPAPERLDRNLLARVRGTYRLDDASRQRALAERVSADTLDSLAALDVHGAAGGIRIDPLGQQPVLLRARDDAFINRRLGLRAVFSLDDDGRPATGLTFAQGKVTLHYVRQ
jgi:CubicO group peptidase (beta-lactamase class C family)